jgi:hypothetical protein
MAHLHEALKIVEDVRNDDHLMVLLSTCDSQTQTSFRKLAIAKLCLFKSTVVIRFIPHNFLLTATAASRPTQRSC